jgi:cell division protein FtsQ
MRPVAIVCLVALGCGALWLWLPTLVTKADNWLKSENSFLVKEIIIEGNHRCQRDEIIKALNLDPRQLIFTFSLLQAQRRITALPFVKQAVISRRLPDRLQIMIKERQPEALLYLDDLYMVDGAGVVIAKAPVAEMLDFPLISGVSLSEWRQRPQVWRGLLQKAMQLLKIWEGHRPQLPEEVAQIVMDEACGLNLFTTGRDWELQMGFENYDERLERWQQVLQVLGKRAATVKYFDCAGDYSVVAGLRQAR